ncbi:MAG: ABC transporter ATP-binding protein/permease [Ruminococcaceae bacterium]|nr:ABC transporter ATP-binding protein/permease [Oscillospiraceae bacterium]
MIRIKNLNKFFNKGRQNEIHVINNVDLEFPDSGMVAVFGKSGCGKTTLLNVIGGLDSFANGSIEIDGKSIRKDTDATRNEYVGYIFQNYNLHKTETCFDNVAAALRLCGMTDKKLIEERVNAALANVGMEKYAQRTPDTLSGGQQQRIAIARAIVKNPRIILADEPTGNLDEANTVMIMDLLRQIAKDHLVILVTHEVNLVDYYCDLVIELKDGRVEKIRTNNAAGGYSTKDKNTLYLGELEKTEISGKGALVEYYGEAPEEPIKLKVVSSGGKLYIKVDTPRVQIIDEYSEIKLRDGVYEEKRAKGEGSAHVDMSKLPAFKGSRFGRLFTFISSLKSGYKANFRQGKFGKKLLRGCMCMFAAVIVLMTALFGTAFKTLQDVQGSYNHNVFYLYTPDAKTSEAIHAALGKDESAIDFLCLDYEFSPQGDKEIGFSLNYFETFNLGPYDQGITANAVYLGMSLADGLELVAGKNDDLSNEEIPITTAVADKLIENSSVGFISTYNDLIGLSTPSFYYRESSMRVAGVVESSESAVYVSDMALASRVMIASGASIMLDSEIDDEMKVENGETVLLIRSYDKESDLPEIGAKVKINGKTFEVSDLMVYYYDYDMWLEGNGIKKLDEREYFIEKFVEEYPEYTKEYVESHWVEEYNNFKNEYYYEYYDYKYDKLDEFLKHRHVISPDMDTWLYFEKGVENIKYIYASEEYYKAIVYKKLRGQYPTYDQMWGNNDKNALYETLPNVYEDTEEARRMYEDEFYRSNGGGYMFQYGNSFIINEKDYIEVASRIGMTDDINFRGQDEGVEMGPVYYAGYAPTAYTVIHSKDPEKTHAFLKENFSYLDTESEYMPEILAPSDIFENNVRNVKSQMIGEFITMGIMIAVMSLCMYFIMRSSLMSRIKEIGIYRAIGVSKKNLAFKFLVESLVLTSLTVVIGYIITSIFINVSLGLSTMVEKIFYYPTWLAGAVLVILLLICTVCGCLPISSLLRKTPSEIIAKYDI